MIFENPEKSEFWKYKKNCWKYHHFLHMCSKNFNHIWYISWDTEWDNLFFLNLPLPPPPLPPPPTPPLTTNKKKFLKKCKKKKKNAKKKKTSGDVIMLNLCYKKQDQMMYSYSRYGVRQIFCHFMSFFAVLPHYWPRKSKLGKNWKNTQKKTPRDVILLCRCTINQDHMMFISWFPRYKVERRKFFFIMVHFLPFNPPNDSKKQYFVVSRCFYCWIK